MNELIVQKVYDVLKERLSIIEHILSGDSSFKLTSKKLKKSFTDMKSNLQKYVDDIDAGVYGSKEAPVNDPVNDVLFDLYYTVLCPNERG